jgi:hypothetical protein
MLSSADFESLASSLEHLLDRFGTEEGTATDELSASAYQCAVQLKDAFLSAQLGLHVHAVPALRPRVLAVDFDQTVTEEDTRVLILQLSQGFFTSAEIAMRNRIWNRDRWKT